MQIFAYLIAAAIPLLTLFTIYKLDFYRTGSFGLLLACFLAGGVGLYAASAASQGLVISGVISAEQVITVTAPLFEEICKAAILFLLVSRPGFTYFVDGAMYGFAAGIGFAIVENYFYLMEGSAGLLPVAAGRVVSANLIHASSSALVGAALGLGRFQRPTRRSALALGGLTAAVLLHFSYNQLVTRLPSGWLLPAAVLLGLSASSGIAGLMAYGLRVERRWIAEKLRQADRVTAGEAAAVDRLASLDELCGPLAERFGLQKARQVENLLFLQARLGILLKTQDTMNDEKLRSAVERQVRETRREMDSLRRSTGSYVMLYLRTALVPAAGSVWRQLEDRIRASMENRDPEAVTNLWTSLQERVIQNSPDHRNPM